MTVAGGSDDDVTTLGAANAQIGVLYALVGGSDDIRRLGAAAHSAADRNGSAVIVGWLLADDHVPPSVEPALRAVCKTVRERLPELPERPRPLLEVAHLYAPSPMPGPVDEVLEEVVGGVPVTDGAGLALSEASRVRSGRMSQGPGTGRRFRPWWSSGRCRRQCWGRSSASSARTARPRTSLRRRTR